MRWIGRSESRGEGGYKGFADHAELKGKKISAQADLKIAKAEACSYRAKPLPSAK